MTDNDPTLMKRRTFFKAFAGAAITVALPQSIPIVNETVKSMPLPDIQATPRGILSGEYWIGNNLVGMVSSLAQETLREFEK